MRDVRYRGALTVTRWRVQNLARSANTEQLILVYGAEGCATKTLRGDGIPVIVALPALVASHEDDRSLREGADRAGPRRAATTTRERAFGERLRAE